MTRSSGLAILLSCALLTPLVFVPPSHAETGESRIPNSAWSKTAGTTAPVQQPSGEINPNVLKALGIVPRPDIDVAEMQRQVARQITGDQNANVSSVPPPSTDGSGLIRIDPVAESQRLSSSREKAGPSVSLSASGLPEVLSRQSALSTALITAIGGANTPVSQVQLLADWDGAEDMTADRSATVTDFLPTPNPSPSPTPTPTPIPLPPNFAVTRTAISPVTFANGHLLNLYYYGDNGGNVYFGADLAANPAVDIIFDANIPTMVNSGTSNGFAIHNPTPGDCMDSTAVVTGMAVNPVADLGDFGPEFCNITGEVIYVSTLETVGCAENASAQKIRTRIFAFSTFNIGSTVFIGARVRQLARTSVENFGGLAVDDDGSLYFSLADFSSVDPVTGIGGLGGAIFKATERPRTLCATPGRINRVISSIPGLDGSTNTTLSQSTPITDATTTLTNYSGTSSVFGNLAAITAGPNDVIYAAAAASNTGVSNATQGVFAAPPAFPNGLPSMIMTFADATGRLDSCSAADPALGIIPIADGIADLIPGTATTWRAFTLGNGPDIRTSSAPLSLVTGSPQNTLKVDMQIDLTTYSGIAVNEEGTAFVISGGTPSGVANNPSPSLSEIMGFEDRQPNDRRGDYVDFRGNNPPVPPASGGNVGDGDSDRFDHIFYQATIDSGTLSPLGLSGLARGFLRYTNRLAPIPISPGVRLGRTGGTEVQGDDETSGDVDMAAEFVPAPIIFENLDPSHQVAGGDDQNSPFKGDDSDGKGDPIVASALAGGFEFSFGGPIGDSAFRNAFFLNSNGNITFGEGDEERIPRITRFRSGPPRIAPAWGDLQPNTRVSNKGTFPLQALGFANVNAFKIRWINVPEFGSADCTAIGGGASNKLSVTLYDDGTGVDENSIQPLNPANPIGNNSVPFDLQEGPTDLRFVPPPVAGASPLGEPPRPDGSGLIVFDYGRMDLLGTEDSSFLTGYSIGNLSQFNPPGLCEVNLSELARAADANPFGVLAGNQMSSIQPSLVGEGTEPTVFEFFNAGVSGSVADFDLRFEGNDPSASKPTGQVDQNRGRVGLLGTSHTVPPNPKIQQIIVTPGAFTPNAGTDLLDALGAVDVLVIGTGFYPNEVTTICEGATDPPEPGIPLQRPGKTVSTALVFALDNNGDSIADATIVAGSVNPISKNVIQARLLPLATAQGTAFPLNIFAGSGTVVATTTFTSGDNNVFGPFTRTGVGTVPLGARAPIVLGVTATSGDCSAIQNLVISGVNFTAGGNATAVFAVEDGNPANVINATSFNVLNNNLIDAVFDFGGANEGKRFLIFVTGPGGTSRNIFPSLPAGAPPGVPLGNEQGNIIGFNCAFSVPQDTLQFSSLNLDVTEESTTVNVTVTRVNPGAGTVGVDYVTSDLSATQKGDYEFAAGTVIFAPGEITKTIPILINEDSFLEGTESFVVNLSNPSGGGVAGGPSTITILDDEIVVLTTNVIDNASDFVRQQYHDFLNRDADALGLAFWTNEITLCGADAACIENKRQFVSAAFFLSIEFQETGGNVLRLQRVAFGKKSNEATTRMPYTQFMRDAQQVGRGVIVGQAGFEALLEQNKQTYAEQVVSSAAFITRFPLALSAAAYVDALFASAGVVPTTAERDAAIAAFGAGGTAGRVAALRNTGDSASVTQAERNPSFVLLQYYGYLRRNPTDAPDANDEGYQFWLAKLNSFGGDFVQAEMVKSFLVSGEYRHRFGP